MNAPCELCTRPADHRHHVFMAANRKWSEQYGLVACLCWACHRTAHSDRETDLRLKRKYQAIFEQQYDRALFMRVFGRNYL